MTGNTMNFTLSVNTGNSATDIQALTKDLKEVKLIIKDLQANQGKLAFINGMATDMKELQDIAKRLQGDIKAIQGMTTKSTATDGIKKGAEEATKEFRTLKQAVKDVEKAIDKAQQSASQTAKYKGQTLDMPQLYAKHSEALQRVQVMEAGFAQNREKALQAEQALRVSMATQKSKDFAKFLTEQNNADRAVERSLQKQYDAKVAMDAKYQQYLRKESLANDKVLNSGDRRVDMYHALDNRSQNKVYNDYYANMGKSIDAQRVLETKISQQYDTAMQQRAVKAEALNRKQAQSVEVLTQKYQSLNDKVKDFYATGTKIPEKQFLGMQRQTQSMESRLELMNPNALNPASLTAYKDYTGYLAQHQLNPRVVEAVAQKVRDDWKKAQAEKVAALDAANAKESRYIDGIAKKYDALNNKTNDYIRSNTQLSERQFYGMQRNAVEYEKIMAKAGRVNSTSTSPLIGYDESGGLRRKTYAEYQSTLRPSDYQGYQRAIANARAEAERLHQVMTKTNTEQSRVDFANARRGLAEATRASEEFNRSIGASHGIIDGFGRRIRSHLEWIVSGGLITAFAVVPSMIENIARETEVLGQKLKQNLELAERYRDNHHGLEEDVRHLGDVAATFAVGYGANVKDVLEMMQVLSRRFKSPEELTYYTNLAMVMHKLDFVAPKKAAEDLEAVILSMGLDFKGAKKFIDEFSVAVN